MKPISLIKAMLSSPPRVAPVDCGPRLLSGEAVLIDVREEREWTAGVAKDAVLLPFTDLTGRRLHWAPFLAEAQNRELLVYCQSGGRSAMAARILAAEGFRTANAGGLAEWAPAGWPIVLPRT